MNNMNLALTLLIAGFVIVFVVLILLIVIITLYGKIIQGAQKSSRQRKEKKRQNLGVIQRSESEPEPTPAAVSKPAADTALNDEIPDEIIAVIAAAVDAVYGGKPHKVRAVRRAGNVRSAWGSAGVIHNTRPF